MPAVTNRKPQDYQTRFDDFAPLQGRNIQGSLMANKRIAIIGAGPAGLMAAEVLSQYNYDIEVYEQNHRRPASF